MQFVTVRPLLNRLAFRLLERVLMVSVRVRTSALLLLALLVSAAPAFAQISVTVAWDANTEPDVTGYVVSWGPRSGFYNASADAGNNTQYTVSGLDPDQRWYFVVQAYTADRLFSLPSAEVSTNGVIVQTSGTLLDQRPNLFWHNEQTGRVLTWHLNGTTVVDTKPLSIDGIADTNWKVAGIGDLNGDRHPDVLWRHATEGWLAVWTLQNNLVTATNYLSINRVADPAWRLGGVGDVNGDRFADLVWQHDDGRLAVWFMQSQNVVGTAVLPYNVGPNSRWQIATIGDVNKDGYADIVWQTTDAWLAVWLLQGGSVLLTQYLSIPQMPDANWRIKAVASPDSTGHPAIVWRHSQRGDVALWYLNGPAVVATIKTTPSVVSNLNWTVVGSR
jgi:hypothetical protein